MNLVLATHFSPIYSNEDQHTIDLNVGMNERVSLKAPSGYGKSSLLKAAFGLASGYRGSLKWRDKEARDILESEWFGIRATQISYVPQGLDLIPHMSVKDNLELVPKQMVNFQEVQTQAKHIGVFNLFTKKAGHLSFGERQRVCILRSLMRPFDLLIMDEPFSHLDDAAAEACCELLDQNLRDRRTSLLITSHKDIPATLNISNEFVYA